MTSEADNGDTIVVHTLDR